MKYLAPIIPYKFCNSTTLKETRLYCWISTGINNTDIYIAPYLIVAGDVR
jgi:hypothetical protein